MKNSSVLAFLLTLASQSLMAQDSVLVLKKISFKASITGFKGKLDEGFLYQVGDSDISFSPESIRFGAVLPNEAESHRIAYPEINSIVIRRKNSGARGALFGALSGLAIGVGVGLAMGDDAPPSNTSPHFIDMHVTPTTAAGKAAALGAAGALTGAFIGAIIGAIAHKTFVIGGRKHDFDRMKKNVLDRAYSKQPVQSQAQQNALTKP